MQFISVVWLTVHSYSSENPKEKSEDLTFETSNRIFLPWFVIDSVFNFSCNTVILVAMSDSWGINSPNTGDDKKIFFLRWGNLHYVMKVDVMMMCYFLLRTWPCKTLNLFCIRYVAGDNPRNTSISIIKCKDLLFFFSTFNFDSTRINFCYNVDSER